MTSGDIRPQEIQATIEEDPQVTAAPKLANAASTVVPHLWAAVPCSNKKQQLTTIQFEDKTYNPYLSKKKMKLMMEVIHFYVMKMDGQLKTNL